MKTRILSEEGISGREEFLKSADKINKIAAQAGAEEDRINVILISRHKMAELNREFKNREGEAEILTFPYGEGEFRDIDSSLRGEIYLCWDTICRGAETRSVPPNIYLERLVVHGIFHLLGYSHGDPDSADRMEEAEKNFLIPFMDKGSIEKMFA